MLYLTRQERAVILFFIGMGLSGLCINFVCKANPAVEKLVLALDPQVKLDINRASVQELEQIKGIGPVLAANIVAWRNINGRFTSIDGLRDVKGIGEYKYNQIRDSFVCVSE